MIQCCLNYSTSAVRNGKDECLGLQMVIMGMDCNLKKIGQLFI